MLTLFTVPRAFTGAAAGHQRNALESWKRLGPDVEVILFGDEPGIEDAARECGARWVPEVARNEYGTPLLDCVFREASTVARHRVLCYANSDIVLLDDFLPSLRRLRLSRFLVGGRRWNLDLDGPIAFGTGWERRVRDRVSSDGRLEKPWGSDYFVFRADGTFDAMPGFAVGRPYWDNWMIFTARRLGIPVVDATRAITAVHPRHDRAHVPDRRGERWEGPEGDRNRELSQSALRDRTVVFHLWDATHLLTPQGLRRAARPKHLWRRWLRTKAA